ncbi:uncharacterized protein LOC113240166 [Hyposmocoma kahamanoa]|uniref:uncharacterized protein LOC113240166 n=1 Tax=Hyposmocoma kahamanoa TaxID=1477025 RepID=UPI000E6DA124|nr:uncharacterized protein LOC113240166 [Hyposmocoma kahamanoa]
MSKYSLYLISRIVTAVLAVSIVIAQTDLTTKKIESPVQQDAETEKNIFEGLMLYKDLCQSTFNSSHDDFMIPFILTGKIADETDRNAKCFFLCMLEMTGVTDSKDGHYDPKQACFLFSPPKSIVMKNVESISEECIKKQVKEDLCDQAYHFMQCVMKEVLHQYGTPQFIETTTTNQPTTTTTELSFIE